MATRTKKAPEAEIAAIEADPVEASVLGYDNPIVDGDEDPNEDDGFSDEGDEFDGAEADGAEPDELQADDDELPVRLVGQELLDFYNTKKAEGWKHNTIGFHAGYVSKTKTGQERFQKSAFNEEWLKVTGVIEPDESSSSSSGRPHAGLTRARVTGQGVLLVSQLATANIEAVEGEVFAVSYPGDRQILLTPTGEVKPVVPRKRTSAPAEKPGTPLLETAEA